MPYALNLSLVSLLNQSVLQAGERTVWTVTDSKPNSLKLDVISERIVSRAGQPEYVGVILTVTLLSEVETSLTIPRSTREITGISGSGICDRAAQISSSVGVGATPTTSHLGTL